MTPITAIPDVKAEPDFNQLLKVLRCEKPDRPTLFEFFLNGPLEKRIVFGDDPDNAHDWPAEIIKTIAFRKAGYDYVTQSIPGFGFPRGEHGHLNTISLNDGAIITDRASMEKCAWPNPDDADYGVLDRMADELPSGMKILVNGPCGVEENVIGMVGYENLCYMMADDEDLVWEIFENVGSRLVRYYENVAPHPVVGGIIGNDDWGFKTQTLLSVEQMDKFLFPWHKRIVEVIHAVDKPAILHSCGYFGQIIDTIIDDLKYDGRHSYEDNILSVEDSYEMLNGRIAVLGGIDVDFMTRSTPEDVYERSKAMVDRSRDRGGYGLGTGNSVPTYIPDENVFAMIRAGTEER